MHPIFARSRRFGLYLLLFLQAGVLLGELLARSTDMARPLAMLVTVPLLVLHAFSCLASWYLCRSLPLGDDDPFRPLLALAAAGVLAAGLLSGLSGLWVRALDQVLLSGGNLISVFAQGRPLVFVFGLLIFSLVAVVHYLFIAAEERRAAVDREFEMRILAREAELRALKAQIDPHFLFNSLNSISSLVTADPPGARNMCIRLAEFLRQSLRFGSRDHIPLAEEIALMTSYLEVEGYRFGDRLATDFRIDNECLELLVPPLILQPLVENAVGHGISHLIGGGRVSISGRRHGDNLRIVVENDCELKQSPRRGEGIGLENVRRRLEARYGDRANLRLQAPWRRSEGEAMDSGFRIEGSEENGGVVESRGRFQVILIIPSAAVELDGERKA